MTRSVLLVEADSVVVLVEEGGVSAHEHITDNDVVEASGSIEAHDAHEARSLPHLSDRHDVVLRGELVCIAVDFNIDGWEICEVGAVLFDDDAFQQRVDDGL